jgi:hypothetical protein
LNYQRKGVPFERGAVCATLGSFTFLFFIVTKLFTLLRLSVLAIGLSFTLTSCFDHDKKDDPRPNSCPAKTKTTTSSSGNN